MEAEFANKIKRLELENFTCFGKVAMDFSPGINVIIGENGTGKTHLLKVLYAVKNGNFEFPSESEDTVTENEFHVENEIKEIFGIAESLNLINAKARKQKFRVSIDSSVSFLENGNRYITAFTKFLFIPIQEMLSWQRGFINLYSNKEVDIDRTYFHLALALDGNLLRGESQKEAEKLVGELEAYLNIKVLKHERKFYITFLENKEEHDSALVATGINKLAQLIYLIMNGSLTKDTILFWDEPESGLNPKYIKIVAQFLKTLANAGCQIFVATHDYLLPYHLSLSVEYADVMKEMKQPVPPMKFFSLYKGENGTKVEEGDTMPSIHHDAIMEGHHYHSEFERELFRKSVNQGA